VFDWLIDLLARDLMAPFGLKMKRVHPSRGREVISKKSVDVADGIRRKHELTANARDT